MIRISKERVTELESKAMREPREITLRRLGTRDAPPLDPRDESPVCDCPGECEGTCTGEEGCATPFEDWPEQEP